MQVILVGKEYFNKLILPQNVAGNYWLSEKIENKELKLVNIEAIDEMWYVSSKQYAKIFEMQEVDNKIQWVKIEDKIVLKEHEFYGVQLGESKEMFLLYCEPVMDKYTHLNIKNKHEIRIGSGKNNEITYYNGWAADCHAKMFFKDGVWLLENYDEKYGIFVNGKVRHKNARALYSGDVVWIMGLKIILIGDSIYINNPKEQCFLSKDAFEYAEDVFEADEDNEKDVRDEDEYFSRAPRLTDIIET